MKRISILFSFIIFFCCVKLQAQWNPVNGLPLTEFSTVYFSNDTIYAASGNIIYRSGDGGNNWMPSDIIHNDVNFVSSIIKIKNRLLAGTYNYGVFESKNNGTSWAALNNGFTGLGSNSIIEFAERGDSIYAGTDGSSIFVMNINDNIWYSYNQNIPMNIAGTVSSLYNFNGRLITGSGSNANIYYNDRGSTAWYEVQFANFDPSGTALLSITHKDGILYGIGNQGIYQSTNSGLNWEHYNPGIGFIGDGKIIAYNNIVYAMLAKVGTTYYLYNSNGNWQNIEAQNGVLTYRFILTNNKIFSARLDGLFFRELPLTPVEDVTTGNPATFSLHQNYPNPFNPSTKIRFSIPKHSKVSLKVYDTLGKEIKTLLNQYLEVGHHEINFDASGLPSGVYFYNLIADNFTSTGKMVLMR